MKKLTSSKNNRRTGRDSRKNKKNVNGSSDRHQGLKGYCMWNISSKGCNKDKCSYKHGPVPADVIEHFKQYYAPTIEPSQD